MKKYSSQDWTNFVEEVKETLEKILKRDKTQWLEWRIIEAVEEIEWVYEMLKENQAEDLTISRCWDILTTDCDDFLTYNNLTKYEIEENLESYDFDVDYYVDDYRFFNIKKVLKNIVIEQAEYYFDFNQSKEDFFKDLENFKKDLKNDKNPFDM